MGPGGDIYAPCAPVMSPLHQLFAAHGIAQIASFLSVPCGASVFQMGEAFQEKHLRMC